MLFPKAIRPEARRTFKAYDGTNNLFNLAYEMLSWKIHRALIKAKLEPFLGFLHSTQHGKPSLVCDFQEVFRFLIEDFLIQYQQKITNESFEIKGRRMFLKTQEKLNLILEINSFLERKIPYNRRNNSKNVKIKAIIQEETIKLAKYLRGNSDTV